MERQENSVMGGRSPGSEEGSTSGWGGGGICGVGSRSGRRREIGGGIALSGKAKLNRLPRTVLIEGCLAGRREVLVGTLEMVFR